MKTECKTEQLEFHGFGRRNIVGKFDGGKITSDGGGVLIRETEVVTSLSINFWEQTILVL
mgnify:CR=1 FL=1